MKLHNRPRVSATRLILTAVCILVLALGTTYVTAQQGTSQPKSDTAKGQDGTGTGESKLPVDTEGVKKKAQEIVGDTKEKVDEIAEQVNKSEKAQEYSAGILKPIYQLAEKLSFPTFHWAAFTVMVTGVVSYGLQLVLGKLVVLSSSG